MAYTVFRNPRSRTFPVSKTRENCVKQESVYVVICPKQGNKMEGVVLNRGNILGHFTLSTESGFQSDGYVSASHH